VGRVALRCIRCSACLNVCPVYERTGGHAYGSVYPGPIGAIVTPLLSDLERGRTLPWASSLCGACLEVCPVKIDIPSVLVHLRGRVVRELRDGHQAVPAEVAERLAMGGLARIFASRRRYESAQRALRLGRSPLGSRWLGSTLPGPLRAWTASRDLPPIPAHTFRQWWDARGGEQRS
jgi:L-lactate dehydrogenase complex protein LldF